MVGYEGRRDRGWKVVEGKSLVKICSVIATDLGGQAASLDSSAVKQEIALDS